MHVFASEDAGSIIVSLLETYQQCQQSGQVHGTWEDALPHNDAQSASEEKQFSA